MENDPEEPTVSTDVDSDVKDISVDEKCTILIEECDNPDSEVNTLTREEKFRVLNLKCEKLIKYLSTGSHMRTLTQNQKRIVRSQAKSHIWDKSRKKLYYTASKDSRKVLVVRDEREVDDIIQVAHLRSDGGHHGINNTVGYIAAKYFWNNIRHDVMEFVSKCYHCQSKNRGSSKKIKEEAKSQTTEIDDYEDIEFTHEATKALIEAIRKRYGHLTFRHTRSILYKEVQEELSQKGFSFNKERVRRKWNTLVAMHKRMRREFFEVNPTWEYYQMIDSFHGDAEFVTQDNKSAVSFPTDQGNSTNTSQGNNNSMDQGNITCGGNVNVPSATQQENVFPPQQGGVFTAAPVNTYPTNQVNNVPINYGNTYPSYGGHTYTNTVQQTGAYNVPPDNSSAIFQGKANVSTALGTPQTPQQKNVNVVIKQKSSQESSKISPPVDNNTVKKTVPMFLKIVPDLSGIQGVNNPQVQPIAVVGALPGQDISQISSTRIILNKPLPKQNVHLKNAHDEFMRKQENLKLKTLMRIEKELKNLSKIQCNILSKQDQILKAVKGKSSDETVDDEEKQEYYEQLKKKIKLSI